MNESTPQEGQKSPWPRRLAMGCGGILVLGLVGLFALNLIAKRVIAGKIEDEIAKNGWEANVGEFDYSLRNKEIEIHDFKGMLQGGYVLELSPNFLNHGHGRSADGTHGQGTEKEG